MQKSSQTLEIGGFVPLTTIDFPGKLSSVVFCQGCPWHCVYCHNHDLRDFRAGHLDWKKIYDRLSKRKGFIDGVVFSGGEPTAQPGLAAALTDTRSLGFLTGLHSNGMFPERLEELLPLLDWVGLDIKAPFDERYDKITGATDTARRVEKSLDILLAAGIDLQLRTTVHPAYLDETALADIAATLSRKGAPATVLQEYRKK